jgi:hypothetical protein
MNGDEQREGERLKKCEFKAGILYTVGDPKENEESKKIMIIAVVNSYY